VDETSWYQAGKIKWLWVLASLKASFFMIHSKRPSATFEELIKYWKGILVLSVTITAFTKKWVVLVAIS
jgi:hypothetical protein